jgi:hypothetical protein
MMKSDNRVIIDWWVTICRLDRAVKEGIMTLVAVAVFVPACSGWKKCFEILKLF